MRTLLVTGGAGFIGSNFVHYILNKYPDYGVVVLDKLTYAGNLDNLRDISEGPRYRFVRGDIADAPLVERVVQEAAPWAIVNFAAETHVDRSILDPGAFIRTDVEGTYVLLEATRKGNVERMLQVSTDEVYGSVPEGYSTESDKLAPRSPYAASKASGDLLAFAYHTTYGVPVLVTRGANNIGPYQYPEKVVPLFTTNALEDLPLPIYGAGTAVRDYIYVEDHCAGIDLVLHRGEPGNAYNIGAGNAVNTLEMAAAILDLLGKPRSLVQHIADRPGHDMRYALDTSRLRALGWQPRYSFMDALEKTVSWYRENEWWWRKLKSGEYREYYRRQYQERPA
ncbi:MAG TPA: dTDP-glucose 4,6-dehydratase [Armatimonadota bacterium]|nr:dTDP-glucose 4,6-dehydratase [Armatimonadota bacterium]